MSNSTESNNLASFKSHDILSGLCKNCDFDYCDDCAAAELCTNGITGEQLSKENNMGEDNKNIARHSTGLIKKRKSEHLIISLNNEIQHTKSNGFEKFQFEINQLPEINISDIDISTPFFNKVLRAPIMISPMTGGNQLGERINKNLAIAAEKIGLAMGVGSQRITLMDSQTVHTFQVRDVAPNIPLFANLGAADLINAPEVENCRHVIETIQADGITLHLNIVQEVLQREGARTFKGMTASIESLCKGLPYPVIVKEVGFGISRTVAQKLESLGVSGIDIAGAGGTSWAMIEGKRLARESEPFVKACEDMALSTFESLLLVRDSVSEVTVIASGGMKTGMDIAKALALGADLVGIAMPLLEPAARSSQDVIDVLERLISELKSVMLCVGAGTLSELRQVPMRHFELGRIDGGHKLI